MLPYGRLLRLVRHLPEDAAIMRSLHGEDARWTLDRQLMAAVVDQLSAANWQRSGGKGRKPQQIPRPGVAQPTDPANMSAEQLSEVVARLRSKPTKE